MEPGLKVLFHFGVFYVGDEVGFTEHLADLLVSYDMYNWKQKQRVRFVGFLD